MIKITVLAASLGLFVSLFITHIIIWNVIRPKKHITMLFVNFIALPVILIGLLAIGAPGLLFSYYGPVDVVFIFLLYFAITGVYIQTYPAIQAWSPSLFILYFIKKQKKAVSLNTLQSVMSDDTMINDRFNDLSAEGFITIVEEDGKIDLTSKGKLLALLFIFYRKALGLDTGKG